MWSTKYLEVEFFHLVSSPWGGLGDVKFRFKLRNLMSSVQGLRWGWMSWIAWFYVAGASSFIVQVIHSLFGYFDPVPCNKISLCSTSHYVPTDPTAPIRVADRCHALGVEMEQSLQSGSWHSARAHSHCMLADTYSATTDTLPSMGNRNPADSRNWITNSAHHVDGSSNYKAT